MTSDPGWAGETRRVDAAFLRERLGERLDDADYMVAGPPGMAQAVTASLVAAGIDETRIATDSFSGY
jgi:NAD(P)H-flavin reductase